jgi:hypothetical protein
MAGPQLTGPAPAVIIAAHFRAFSYLARSRARRTRRLFDTFSSPAPTSLSLQPGWSGSRCTGELMQWSPNNLRNSPNVNQGERMAGTLRGYLINRLATPVVAGQRRSSITHHTLLYRDRSGCNRCTTCSGCRPYG